MNISGVNVKTLIKNCGSPLQVYDQNHIENQIHDFQTYFTSKVFDTEVIYASKAFTCAGLLHIIKELDISLDVVSGGELYVAQSVAFDPSKIYFHGNNKTKDEIRQALEYGVKVIVVDNIYEIDVLLELSLLLNKEIHILIRLNPKVEAHTHEYITTATSDSKFGIDIERVDDIVSMIQKVQASNHVIFDGFHSHIGSQIFANDAFVHAIDTLTTFISYLKSNYSIQVNVLNVGGGFGVKYTNEDTPSSIKAVSTLLIQALEESCSKHKITLKKVCIEPGRSMVAEAGYTLYTVGFTKKTKNKRFAFVDGGMADNIRPALYGAKYACDIVDKENDVKEYMYDIAGKCCESGDILIKNAMLPKVESNDILVVYSTGAYGYSMASNYNRLNKVAVVFVKDGEVREVLRRETYEDQMRLESSKIITMKEE